MTFGAGSLSLSAPAPPFLFSSKHMFGVKRKGFLFETVLFFSFSDIMSVRFRREYMRADGSSVHWSSRPAHH